MSPRFWDSTLTCRTARRVCAGVCVCVLVCVGARGRETEMFLGAAELKGGVMEEVILMVMVMVMTLSRNSWSGGADG